MRLGVIGTGTIASALVRGIAGDGHAITVSERGHAHSARLARDCGVTVADNQSVVEASDVIFVALMPDAAPGVLKSLAFRPGQRVVSLMGGVQLKDLAAWVSPGDAAAIMLPFPAIATGGAPILAQGDIALIESLFAPRNTVFAIRDGAEMDAFLCAQAVLSPVARMVADAADWLGARIAEPEQGEAFLRALVASSLTATDSTSLITALNTEGGYNQRLRLHMEASGMGAALQAGLNTLENP